MNGLTDAECFVANAIARARLTVQRLEEDRIAGAIMADSVATKAVQDPRYSLERFKERLRNEDAMKDTEMPLTHVVDPLLNENALLRRSLAVLAKKIEELEAKKNIQKVSSLPDGLLIRAETEIRELKIELAKQSHRNQELCEDRLSSIKHIEELEAKNTLSAQHWGDMAREIHVKDARIKDLESKMLLAADRLQSMAPDVEAREHRIDELEAEINKMRGDLVEAVPDLERIASALRKFYFSEYTISALQPIISLAIELNPDIVEQRR